MGRVNDRPAGALCTEGYRLSFVVRSVYTMFYATKIDFLGSFDRELSTREVVSMVLPKKKRLAEGPSDLSRAVAFRESITKLESDRVWFSKDERLWDQISSQ